MLKWKRWEGEIREKFLLTGGTEEEVIQLTEKDELTRDGREIYGVGKKKVRLSH